MGWHAELTLHYRREGDTTLAHDRHQGPLRVLQPLYPEGLAICQHVLVHPPGGVAGGDELHLALRIDEGAHALITTPGATRFYRSAGEHALQRTEATLAPDARLEWLPLEAIAYDACLARNEVRFTLAEGAAMIGWDVLALGLPAASQPFTRGRYTTQIEWPGHWREYGVIDATDARLLESPLGLAGQRVLGTLWLASGSPLTAAQRDVLLEAAREEIAASPLAAWAGATAPCDGLVLLRALAHRTEPLMALLQRVHARWRALQWQLPPQQPRIWRT